MKPIQKQLREDLEYFKVSNASPEEDEFEIGIEEDCEFYDEIKEVLHHFNNLLP